MQIIILDPSRWRECKELRLQALQNDPTSFASSYEDDAALPDQRWVDWLKNAQEGTSYLLFAEQNSILVGMVGAIIDKDKKQAIIIAMYVNPDYRGKKIGRQLMQELLKKLDADTRIQCYILKVNIQALPAIFLYENLGFKRVKIEPKKGHFFGEELIMEKCK